MKRIVIGVITLMFIITGVGCAGSPNVTQSPANMKDKTAPIPIRIGALPTADALPIYVAQQKGMFKASGVDVKVIVFKSAQELVAAFMAGQIDGCTGDMLTAAELKQGGTPVSCVSLLLCSTPFKRHFGIVSSPRSKIKSVADLKGVPIAISSNTIIEYTTDGILKKNGIADADIKKLEIKALSLRLELLMSGQAQAATLPEPLLSFAEKQGAHLIVDDTRGSDLSQAVLLFRDAFMSTAKNTDAVKNMLRDMNASVQLINKDPDSYRALLIEKAELPKPIVNTYKVGPYPMVQLPAKADVQRLLAWMVQKKIIKGGLAYEDLVNQKVQYH